MSLSLRVRPGPHTTSMSTLSVCKRKARNQRRRCTPCRTSLAHDASPRVNQLQRHGRVTLADRLPVHPRSLPTRDIITDITSTQSLRRQRAEISPQSTTLRSFSEKLGTNLKILHPRHPRLGRRLERRSSRSDSRNRIRLLLEPRPRGFRLHTHLSILLCLPSVLHLVIALIHPCDMTRNQRTVNDRLWVGEVRLCPTGLRNWSSVCEPHRASGDCMRPIDSNDADLDSQVRSVLILSCYILYSLLRVYDIHLQNYFLCLKGPDDALAQLMTTPPLM